MTTTSGLLVTQEMWGQCEPTWDGLVAYAARVGGIGYSVREWRMHPMAYMDMLQDIDLRGAARRAAATGFINPYARERGLLGCPLVIDSLQHPETARALLETITVDIAPPYSRKVGEG